MSADYANKLRELEQQQQGITAYDVEVVEDIIGELYSVEPQWCNARLDSGLVYIEGSYTQQDVGWEQNTQYKLHYWKEPSGELCSELQITIHDLVLERVDDSKGIAGVSTTYKLGRKGTIPTNSSIYMRDLRYTKVGLTEVSAFDRDEFYTRTRDMNQFDVHELIQLLFTQLEKSLNSDAKRS